MLNMTNGRLALSAYSPPLQTEEAPRDAFYTKKSKAMLSQHRFVPQNERCLRLCRKTRLFTKQTMLSIRQTMFAQCAKKRLSSKKYKNNYFYDQRFFFAVLQDEISKIRMVEQVLLIDLYLVSSIYPDLNNISSHLLVSFASFNAISSLAIKSALLCPYLLSAIFAQTLVALLPIWFDMIVSCCSRKSFTKSNTSTDNSMDNSDNLSSFIISPTWYDYTTIVQKKQYRFLSHP